MPAILPEPMDVKIGDTFHYEAQWVDSTGANVDLDGCTALMQFRESENEDPTLELSTENGLITLAAGSISLDIPAATTKGLEEQYGMFDLELTYSDGTVITVLTGRYRILPDYAYLI